jgi:hypothetical protein
MTDKLPTKSAKKIINKAVEIAMNPATSKDTAFTSTHLVQANLPHSKPKTDTWSRKNGSLTLGIQAGFDFEKNESVGLPYGSLPRLVIVWLVTEAIRTKSRRLELGESLAGFMREIGLNPDNGTGKRSDAKRLKEQMEKLFMAKFSFTWTQTDEKNGSTGYKWLNMDVSNRGELWWDIKNPNQGAIFGSWVELGEEFYKAIIANPMPLDIRALITLKQSPLALDLYMLMNYEAYKAQKNGKKHFIPWSSLHEQMGAEYSNVKDFKRYLKISLRKVKAVSPFLNVSDDIGGLTIAPESIPCITQKE